MMRIAAKCEWNRLWRVLFHCITCSVWIGLFCDWSVLPMARKGLEIMPSAAQASQLRNSMSKSLVTYTICPVLGGWQNFHLWENLSVTTPRIWMLLLVGMPVGPNGQPGAYAVGGHAILQVCLYCGCGWLLCSWRQRWHSPCLKDGHLGKQVVAVWWVCLCCGAWLQSGLLGHSAQSLCHRQGKCSS